MIKVFHLVIDLLSANRLPIQNVRDHFDQLFRVDRFYQVEIKASLDGHFFVLGQTVTSHRNQRQRLSARFSYLLCDFESVAIWESDINNLSLIHI